MSFISTNSVYIGLGVAAVIFCFVGNYMRARYAQRHVAPYPMQVVVCGEQQQYYSHPLPQAPMCWTVPMEQPPPAYNTVVTGVESNRHVITAH